MGEMDWEISNPPAARWLEQQERKLAPDIPTLPHTRLLSDGIF